MIYHRLEINVKDSMLSFCEDIELDLFFLVKKWDIFSEPFPGFLTCTFYGPLMDEQAAVGKE